MSSTARFITIPIAASELSIPRRQPAEEVDPTASEQLEARIEQEIADHGKTWCKENCISFRPRLYRSWRRRGRSFEKMKFLHDCCHIGDDD